MSKTDQAYETLRRDILSGALAPDEPLTRYGFGWTPVRDSLSRKARTWSRWRATVAIGWSAPAMPSCRTSSTRLAVETQLLRDSIRLGDDDWQKRVLLAHRTLSRAPALHTGMSDADYEIFAAAHQAFHLALVGGGNSLWLARFLDQVYAQVCRHQSLIVLGRAALSDQRTDVALLASLQVASAIEHHTRLTHAVLERAEDRGVQLMKEHIGAVQEVGA